MIRYYFNQNTCCVRGGLPWKSPFYQIWRYWFPRSNQNFISSFFKIFYPLFKYLVRIIWLAKLIMMDTSILITLSHNILILIHDSIVNNFLLMIYNPFLSLSLSLSLSHDLCVCVCIYIVLPYISFVPSWFFSVHIIPVSFEGEKINKQIWCSWLILHLLAAK